MNARPDLSTVRAIDDRLADVPLLDPIAAREIILEDVGEIVGDETRPLGTLLGRVTSVLDGVRALALRFVVLPQPEVYNAAVSMVGSLVPPHLNGRD